MSPSALPFDNPYSGRGKWHKAQFHIHTDRSDGRVPPAEALRRYAAAGFSVVGLADHDLVTQVAAAQRAGLLVVPGFEASCGSVHFLGVGTKRRGTVRHVGVNATLRAFSRERSLAVLCHPGWSNLSWAETWAARSVAALEVYNDLSEFELGRGYAVERWDMLLAAGRRLWAFASDDAHWRAGDPAPGGGFVMVRLAKRTRTAVLAALRSGDYFATQGPLLRELTLSADSVALRTSPCMSLRAIADGVGAGLVLHADRPRRRWRLDLARWPSRWPQTYLRLELRDAEGRTAWLNPFFVR